MGKNWGSAFWNGFLFETPFVILRASIPLIMVIYMGVVIKIAILYYKEKNSKINIK